MEFVKRKFLLLDIQGQIQFGILTVSSCVGILVFSMLVLYSFVIINLSYFNVMETIDQMENKGIQAVSLFFDTNLSVNGDISKIGMQWLNNIIANLENYEVLPYIPNEEIRKYFITQNNYSSDDLLRCKSLEINCFYFNNFDKDFNLNSKFIQTLYHTKPFLDILLNFRSVNLKQTKIFDKISIYSNTLKSSFYYPFNVEPNLNFNFLTFKNYMTFLATDYMKKLNTALDQKSLNNAYLTEYNLNIVKNRNLKQIIESTPAVSIFDYSTNNTLYSLYHNKTTADRTFSIKFKNGHSEKNYFNNSNRTLTMFPTPYEILDHSFFFLVGDWTYDISHAVQSDTYSHFPDVKALYTYSVTANEVLLTGKSCEYFRKLYLLNNPEIKVNFFEKLNYTSTILQCFGHPSAQEAINYLIKIPEWLSNNYKRKLKYPIINFYGESPLKETGINYKIFKYHYPEKFGLNTLGSEFMHFNSFFIYLFKNTRYTEIQSNLVFFKFTAIMIAIIIVNFIIWMFILLIIFFLTKKISKDLTLPIQDLIFHVTNIGLSQDLTNQTSTYDYIRDLENIKYQDDDIINDMFEICKDLIKGGFILKDKNKKFDYGLDSHFIFCINNVSCIKTNNLKIDEVFIDRDYNEHVKNVFNFTPMKIILIKDAKKEDFIKFELISDFEGEAEGSINENENEESSLISEKEEKILIKVKPENKLTPTKNNLSRNQQGKRSLNQELRPFTIIKNDFLDNPSFFDNKKSGEKILKKMKSSVNQTIRSEIIKSNDTGYKNEKKKSKKISEVKFNDNINFNKIRKHGHLHEYTEKDFFKIAKEISNRYSRVNILYDGFSKIGIKEDQPYPLTFCYSHNVKCK
jgi:hypothetical protein